MANEAHKEPTMEEILASIRKIISDDDAPEDTAAAAPVEDEPIKIEDAENDDFEDFDLDAAEAQFDGDDMFEAEAEPEPETQVEGVAPAEVEANDDFNDMPSFDDLVDAEPEAAPAPVPPVVEPAPVSRSEEMPASAKYESTILTEEDTADAAAGALGKLISRMDLGGDNTIEGLVREMLKPMIKEWLDTNLPGIVEEKVEAEVQRIARMAR